MVAPHENTKLKIGDSTFITKIWKHKKLEYKFAYTDVSLDYLNFFKSIKAEYLFSPDMDIVVVYLNKYLNESDIVNYQDVLGLAIYKKQEDYYKFTFYNIDNGAYNIIRELNCGATKLSSNDIFDIYSIFYPNQTKVTSLVLRNINSVIVNNKNKSHNLKENIKFLKRKSQSYSLKFRPPNPIPECEFPCPSGDAACEQGIDGIWNCDYTFDPPEVSYAQSNYLIENGSNPSFVDSAYDPGLQYWFRDSFLQKYSIGQKYIEYYYGMTASSYLTPQIMQHTPQLLNKLSNKIHDFLYNGNTSQVLIDSDTKTEAIYLLNLYYNEAPNQVQKAYFTDIINDVNIYSGKTFGQIIDMIE